ncbi:uncharacterized protein LOC103097302 [Monodelphis domestica]|uniref:uncharacterized protein LOC103097302 n=1 Tax=Monodelphis domestica TaxID=13616 RepID=UPI0024E1CB4C|nr:uncharacterized protein LOC103097302 [Monodelphis domestica]
MRLCLLSLVVGITMGVTGIPLGKVFTRRQQTEVEKEGQDSLEPNNELTSLYQPESVSWNLTETFEDTEEDKPKKAKRQLPILGSYSGMTSRAANDNETFIFIRICGGTCNESKTLHENSPEKEKEEKRQREPHSYREPVRDLNLPGTILQLLNQTKATNRSASVDFILQNQNGSITRDLCEGCCEEKEKDLGRKSNETSKYPKKKRVDQWSVLGRVAPPPGKNSNNMVAMKLHNDTDIDNLAKKAPQQANDLRGRRCSACCADDRNLAVLVRRD